MLGERLSGCNEANATTTSGNLEDIKPEASTYSRAQKVSWHDELLLHQPPQAGDACGVLEDETELL